MGAEAGWSFDVERAHKVCKCAQNKCLTPPRLSRYTLQEGRSEEIFAYIEADDRLDHILCHLFACEQGLAERMCLVSQQNGDWQLSHVFVGVFQPTLRLSVHCRATP